MHKSLPVWMHHYESTLAGARQVFWEISQVIVVLKFTLFNLDIESGLNCLIFFYLKKKWWTLVTSCPCLTLSTLITRALPAEAAERTSRAFQDVINRVWHECRLLLETIKTGAKVGIKFSKYETENTICTRKKWWRMINNETN